MCMREEGGGRRGSEGGGWGRGAGGRGGEERRNGEEPGAGRRRPGGGGWRRGAAVQPGRDWAGPGAGELALGSGVSATGAPSSPSGWCGLRPPECSPTARFIFLVLMTPLPVRLN